LFAFVALRGAICSREGAYFVAAGHGDASKKEGVESNRGNDEAEGAEEGEEEDEKRARRRETGGDEGDAYRAKGSLVTFPWSRHIRNEITSIQ